MENFRTYYVLKHVLLDRDFPGICWTHRPEIWKTGINFIDNSIIKKIVRSRSGSGQQFEFKKKKEEEGMAR